LGIPKATAGLQSGNSEASLILVELMNLGLTIQIPLVNKVDT
jgi:hypothetical protein